MIARRVENSPGEFTISYDDENPGADDDTAEGGGERWSLMNEAARRAIDEGAKDKHELGALMRRAEGVSWIARYQQMLLKHHRACSHCGQAGRTKKCTRCRSTQYCDRECQRGHYPVHKLECRRIAKLEDPVTSVPGHPHLVSREKPRFKLKVLSDDERAERMHHSGFTEEEMFQFLGADEEEELLAVKPRYEHEGFGSAEEAAEEIGQTVRFQREAIPGWKYRGYGSMRDYYQSDFRADSKREAIWDYACVPRIEIIWDDDFEGSEHDRLKREDAHLRRYGWEFEGYKPGRNVVIDSGCVKLGERVIGGSPFGAWKEVNIASLRNSYR